jgi:hypothetical protein
MTFVCLVCISLNNHRHSSQRWLLGGEPQRHQLLSAGSQPVTKLCYEPAEQLRLYEARYGCFLDNNQSIG